MKKTSGLSTVAQRSPEPEISWLMKLSLDRPEIISLAAGFTDNASLPVEDTRHLLDEILRSPRAGQPALQYGTTAGDLTLRKLTAAHVQRCDRGADEKLFAPERVLITNGSQQLLYITAEALCDAGDIILVEDPTYFVFLGITASHGIRCRGVRMDEHGVCIDHLEQVLEDLKRRGELPRLKVLYLVTYYQNPTGRTTSLARKQEALALLRRYEKAAGHPIYLLEDAAYRELRFSGDDVSSALVGKHADRVIYAGTYSKPFATGARVGFGLLPEPVLGAARRIKGNHDFGTANLLQQLMSKALSSGIYDRHLVTLRERYAEKAATMVRAISKHFPADIKRAEPEGGLYVWAQLPAKIRSGAKSKLFATALEANVLYVPGELCYCADDTRPRPNSEMRISFGGANIKDIDRGIERLAGAIEACR